MILGIASAPVKLCTDASREFRIIFRRKLLFWKKLNCLANWRPHKSLCELFERVRGERFLTWRREGSTWRSCVTTTPLERLIPQGCRGLPLSNGPIYSAEGPRCLQPSCPEQLKYPIGYFSASIFIGGLLNEMKIYICIYTLQSCEEVVLRRQLLSASNPKVVWPCLSLMGLFTLREGLNACNQAVRSNQSILLEISLIPLLLEAI